MKHTFLERITPFATRIAVFTLSFIFLTVPATSPAFGADDIVLELTLKDAVDIALARNFGLQLQHKSVLIQETSIMEEQGAFDPTWDTSLSMARTDQPSSSLFEGGGGGVVIPGDTPINTLATDPTITLDQFRSLVLPFSTGGPIRISHSREDIRNFNSGLSRRSTWGTLYGIDFNQSRTDTSTSIFGINPRHETALRFNLVQPLLRNAFKKINTTQLRIAEINSEAEDLSYRLTAINLISSVEQAYWNVHRSKADISIAEKSIETAQDLLRQNEAKVEVGVLRPIEVLSAKSGLAARQQILIAARKRLDDARDYLLRLLELRDGDELWKVTVEPADDATFETVHPDTAETLQKAKQSRLELQQQDSLIEALTLARDFSKNQLLPSIDLSTGIGIGGLGGNPGNSYDNLFTGDHISWNAGLSVSVPIGNKTAKARLRRSALELEARELAKQDLERSIELQVREAVRAVESAQELVNASEVTVNFATERLKAEQSAYAEGVTTSHEVLRFEEDLTTAQNNYNQALIDHLNALVALRVAQGNLLESAGVEIITPRDENQ